MYPHICPPCTPTNVNEADVGARLIAPLHRKNVLKKVGAWCREK